MGPELRVLFPLVSPVGGAPHLASGGAYPPALPSTPLPE